MEGVEDRSISVPWSNGQEGLVFFCFSFLFGPSNRKASNLDVTNEMSFSERRNL